MVKHKELVDILDYDSEKNVFTWRFSAGRVKAGDIAGSSNGDGYWRIKIGGKKYYYHKLVLFYISGVWPKLNSAYTHNCKRVLFSNHPLL